MKKPVVQCDHYGPHLRMWGIGECWFIDDNGTRWDIEFRACHPCLAFVDQAFLAAMQREHQRRPFFWMGLPS